MCNKSYVLQLNVSTFSKWRTTSLGACIVYCSCVLRPYVVREKVDFFFLTCKSWKQRYKRSSELVSGKRQVGWNQRMNVIVVFSSTWIDLASSFTLSAQERSWLRPAAPDVWVAGKRLQVQSSSLKHHHSSKDNSRIDRICGTTAFGNLPQ